MVERLQESLKGVTFVDLDGTLLRGNSMKMFMKRLPGLLLKRRAPGAAIAALWWTWLRGFRLTCHKKMKWHLTRIARRYLEDEDWEGLAARMTGKIDSTVSDFVESRRKRGCLTYIATAALEEYAVPLSRMMGYEGAVATRFDDDYDAYDEMKGYAKHDGIEDLLADGHLRLESFITDHTDDIPTASAYPGLTILLDPSNKTAEQFRHVGVTRYLLKN